MISYSKKTLTMISLTLLATSAIFTNLNLKLVEAADTPRLYVFPSTYEPAKVGEIFQIQVKIQQFSPTSKVFKYEFKLGFNATQLDCLEALQGDFFSASTSTSIIQIDNTAGYVDINCTLKPGERPITGGGNLAFITFNATYGVPYPMTHQTSQFHIYDSYINRASRFPGDISGDNKVSLPDLVFLAKAYGSKPGDSNWNPDADIDKNGNVGLSDLVILAKVYGVEVELLMSHTLQDGTYYTPWIAPTLELTLTTNKNSYTYNENIIVSGSLLGNGYPVPDAYVAIEVDAPNGRPIVARTVPTGTIPPAGPVTILSVVPCDDYGNPKSSFRRGEYANFKVTIRSNIDQPLSSILVPINVYDSNNATQGVLSSDTSLGPGEQKVLVLSLYVENTFALGTGKVYANVFTDWVKNGGIALCNEKAATFTITLTAGMSASNAVAQATANVGILVAGNYEINFKIPQTEANPAGTYNIYVSSMFMEKTAFNNKGITVS